jgi:hypothetical protein
MLEGLVVHVYISIMTISFGQSFIDIYFDLEKVPFTKSAEITKVSIK